MTSLPPAIRDYLTDPALLPVWQALRSRLESNGLQLTGTIAVSVDAELADRLGGLLGRRLTAGRTVRLGLRDLDAALRRSAAQRGLLPVVAELTGGPLRDRPAERESFRSRREQLWAGLDAALVDAGLASADWVEPWSGWLRRGGVVARLPPESAASSLRTSVSILAALLADDHAPQSLGEFATVHTGSAHGLDNGTVLAALVLRGLAFALDIPAASTPGERRALWERVGISTDEISGTVLVWALRPPGAGRWAAMMRERADLGLITHLTTHELRRARSLVADGTVVHACENPQVLQALATAGVDRPVVCVSGNPSTAGALLLDRVPVRYHGDFDWPGIAIARRILTRGAAPWRFGAGDYLEAVDRLSATNRLPLTGRPEPAPWDSQLQAVMAATDVAVHEEALLDVLIGDLVGS